MNVDNGNIYGPDDAVPDGVELTEIDKEQFDSLRASRKADVEEAQRRIEQRQTNPGRN